MCYDYHCSKMGGRNYLRLMSLHDNHRCFWVAHVRRTIIANRESVARECNCFIFFGKSYVQGKPNFAETTNKNRTEKNEKKNPKNEILLTGDVPKIRGKYLNANRIIALICTSQRRSNRIFGAKVVGWGGRGGVKTI